MRYLSGRDISINMKVIMTTDTTFYTQQLAQIITQAVKKKQRIPGGKIYAGSPAREIGGLTERHRSRLRSGLQSYADLIKTYHKTFKRVV